MKKNIVLLFLTFLCIGQLSASQEKWDAEIARHEKEMEVVKQYCLKNIDDPEMILLFSFYQGKEWLRRAADLYYGSEHSLPGRKKYLNDTWNNMNKKALECFRLIYDKCSQLSENNRRILGDLYYNIGVAKNRQEKYNISKQCFLMALKEFEMHSSIAPSIALREKIANCYHNLGLCYLKLQEYNAALKYMKKYKMVYPKNSWIQKDIEHIEQQLKKQNAGDMKK